MKTRVFHSRSLRIASENPWSLSAILHNGVAPPESIAGKLDSLAVKVEHGGASGPHIHHVGNVSSSHRAGVAVGLV